MKVREYFDLGCKLFGVYFLFLSVPLFIATISTFYPIKDISPDFEKYLTFYTLITRALPIIYVIIGVYLLKNSRKLTAFAYRSIEEPIISESSEKFRLFLKMLGIYLFSEYLPDLLLSITSYLTYSNAPKVLDFLTQQQYAHKNFIPSAVAIVLGIYLVRDGRFFVNLGFRKLQNNKDD